MRRRDPNRAAAVPVMETMEPRLLLASDFVISEILADNTKGLKDKDGAFSDWIEITNTGLAALNLNGYYLTDSASNLTMWRFPSVSVPAGGYLVVFASDKNIRTLPELHTNFKLSAGGEYLALVEPDGHTIAYEYAPQYPDQFPDVSYGLGQEVTTKTLVGPDAATAVLIPANSGLGLTWTDWAFDDALWTLRGTSAVGYESMVAGWAVRDYLAAITVATLAQAESVISTPANRRDQTVYVENTTYVNYYNSGGDAHYNNGRNLPGVSPPYNYTANLVMEATGWITVPQAGLYTFGVNSDDGFGLTITGATTTWTQDSTTPAGSSIMDYQGSRGAGDTFATYSFPTAGQYPVRLVWFQGTSGAEVEVFGTPGSYRAFNYTDYKLVGDTANGGLAMRSTPVSTTGTYATLIHTDVKTAMQGVNASAYIRLPFELTDTAIYNSLALKMKYDDGFVAYLNGAEVARRFAPGSVAWNSGATADRSRTDAMIYEEIDISSRLNLLRVGTNVLAIQGLNYGAAGDDFLILPELVDTDVALAGLHYFSTPTPRSANLSAYFAYVEDTKFDFGRGFYDAPFDVTITTATPEATIRYTTDGTAPTATTGTVYTAPVHITTTTTLRAAAYKTGFLPTNVDTQTYIFLGNVLTQPPNPAGFPTTWGGVSADYAMDQSVVTNPLYSGEIINDLKAIPTISIVMKTAEMFGPGGIYSNTEQQGEVWERAASVELINPDGTPGFQADVGIRIYGGVNRNPSVKKHTFRLFFNDNLFGAKDLKYPLFSDTYVDEFDSLILRGDFNDAWGPMSLGGQSQFARDEWSRRTANAMGLLAPHGNHVHLYINGLYWGVYNPVERPDHHFAASYFGGDDDEYDVLHDAAVVAGNRTAWDQMMAAANAGLATEAAYQNFQKIVDVTALADYCMIPFYTENWDWDDHNWYATRNRNGGKWHWYIWDSEWIMPGDLYNPNMIGTNLGDRGSHVFQQLRQNAEFRVLFMDRVYKHFYNGGAMSAQVMADRYRAVTDEIYGAIVAESARWGDYNRQPAYTRNGEWLNERNRLLNTYFPQRQAIFLGQLRSTGLYPKTEAPGFSQHGGTIAPGFQFTMSNPNQGGVPPAPVGTIYYTLDGTDPRLPGGGISSGAVAYTGSPITLQSSTMVQARIKNDNEWSAMHEAAFVLATPPPLRVTELMYHPENPPPNSEYSDNDFEFIEVQNIGSTPLNVGGMKFTGAVTFTFPDLTLPLAGYALVVSNLPAFQSRYNTAGLTIAGQYLSGHLNNAGDTVVFEGKFGEPIQTFTYSPTWYPASDGLGYSLNILNPSGALALWSVKEGWSLSNYAGGSPGTDNSGLVPGAIAINELLAHTEVDPRMDWVELTNTTTDPINVGGWWLSDERANLTKYQIAPGTMIQPGEYLLLTERDNFRNPEDPGYVTPFAYSEYGETVFLTGVDQYGNLTGYREEQDFGASDREMAFTRYVTSTGSVGFVAEAYPTPLADNAPPRIGPVVISEVMYHPLNDTDEFVELHNITDAPVLLYDPAHPANTWKIDGGITYIFATGLSIPAGGYLLVVNTDTAAFRTRYGVPPDVQIVGPFTGFLNNAGNNVKLYRPGDPDPLPPYQVPYPRIDRVEYDDLAPWPVQPDGFGPSLQRLDVTAYGNDPANWGPGPDEGSPGRLNSSTDVTPPRVVTASAADGDSIHVLLEFNEGVDPVTSLIAANYSIPGLTIYSVDPGSNNRLVVLNTAPMANGVYYTVTVTGVTNLAGITIGDANRAMYSYSGAGVGLWGQYYQYPPGNINWANVKLARLDPVINFDWGGNSPDPLVMSDLFSVRWTGKVKPLYTETYSFYTISEDGVRLWVDNQLLIDNWTAHPATENVGTIALVAGQKYDIKIEYYEDSGLASMKLSWSSPHTPNKEIIPTSQLFSNAVPPVSIADNYTAPANVAMDVPAPGVLANDGDPNGYPLTAVLRRRASHGSVTLRTDGSFTYTPTAGYQGQDTFSYKANNGLMDGAETMVYLLVDKPPVVTSVVVNQDNQAQGLGAQYYQWGAGGVDWANPRLTRRDAAIDFDWGAGSPDPLLGADKFAARWTGKITPQYSETYTFYALSDEGVRLWVNDKLVIDRWAAHTATEYTGTFTFAIGQTYDIKVEYYEDTGPAVMKLSWSSLNTPKQIIPAAALTPVERSLSYIDPGVAGVKTVDIGFSKAVTFLADDVLLERVTFNGNSETVLETVTPVSVYGYGFDFMTITLAPNAVVDGWLKVTLKGSGTLQAKDNLKLRLDGEPKAGGSGRAYLYRAAADLPTGNGLAGGDAVFYVGSLRGDFGSVGGGHVPDGLVTEEDVDGYVGSFQAGNPDADFRGVGFADAGTDGQITPSDFDGFMSLYQQTVVQPRSIPPLPDPGPQGEGAPQPLAAGEPEPVAVALAPAADGSGPPAGGDPVPVLGEPPTAPTLEVDVLATAPEIGSADASALTLTGPAPTEPALVAPLAAPIIGLTGVTAAVTEVPLASAAAGEAALPRTDPVLSPDGGVDLLALPALDVMLVA